MPSVQRKYVGITRIPYFVTLLGNFVTTVREGISLGDFALPAREVA
jgi:hypothetical protein